ncbi:hypothetical protein [Labilibaculum antarcticum]|uniref:Uncharacterized protein n=1 Tax=Labilibaculum antarcticum TaxID=1717717 RepID=A0A1Y1CMZ8_9BACT|nr:hypothetical protein [Labilibaculum antarcticum]BAX81735.1 hypothetical protein ALGA_3437 [Labilibaculum antarcticum]
MYKIIFLSFIFSIALFASCTFEVSEEPRSADIDLEVENGTTRFEGISDSTLNSIPVDAGEIGVAIDTRKLAVLGYKPSKVSFTIIGDLSTFTQSNIQIDPYTHVALFKLSRKDLTEEQITEFSEGVAIEARVFDAENVTMETMYGSKFIINSTNRTIKIESEKPHVQYPMKLNADMPYYLAYEGFSLTNYLGAEIVGNFSEMSGTFIINSTLYHNDPTNIYSKLQKFYFIEIEENIYAIKTAHKNSYLEINDKRKLAYNIENTDDNPNFVLGDKHKFILEQTAKGTIEIRSLSGGTFSFYNGGAPFTFIAANITWEFNDLGTEYSAAILPPAQMDFAFDQTIHNCSGATGEYYVGNNREETKTVSIDVEETASFYSSTTDSKEATVEAEAGGEIFGIGASVSASGTIGTSRTRAFGSGTGTNKGKTYTETQTVSSNRVITVPPYTSVEVFDVIQKLKNVRIPFAQRVLLRAANDEGIPLSGEEIQSQLGANQFGGVVLEVGSDYIEYSVRGSINVANYFEYKNTVNDIVGICN